MTELLMSTPLDAEQSEYSEAVRHSAEALLTVINDILDVSRSRRQLKLEVLPFDPRSIIDEVVGLLMRAPPARGCALPRSAGAPAAHRSGATGTGAPDSSQPDRKRRQVYRRSEWWCSRLAGDDAETASVRFSVRTGIGIVRNPFPPLFRASSRAIARRRASTADRTGIGHMQTACELMAA